MPENLLIFGGKGFVGENMALLARSKGWQVFIADSSPTLEPEWLRVNITEYASVERVISRVKPDAVVNVAAIADIDRVEREKDLAYQVNVVGARQVAECCAKKGIRYVFFSSDAVFDGQGSTYAEDDLPNPVNYYGQTKLEAEQAVLSADPGAVVIRISLVLGFPITGGNSFFAGLENKLRQGNQIISPSYEVRTPVDVITLSECVLELCQNSYCGILHIGATDSINRFDLSKILAEKMGLDAELVIPQEAPEDIPGRAQRHKNGIIDVSRAQKILKTRLLSTREGIERAFLEKQTEKNL